MTGRPETETVRTVRPSTRSTTRPAAGVAPARTRTRTRAARPATCLADSRTVDAAREAAAGGSVGGVVTGGTRPEDWQQFNQAVTSRQRVDAVVDWMRRPADTRPRFVTLYFDTVDTAGHDFGPDTAQVTDAIRGVDEAVGHLVEDAGAEPAIVAPVGLDEDAPRDGDRGLRLVGAGVGVAADPSTGRRIDAVLMSRRVDPLAVDPVTGHALLEIHQDAVLGWLQASSDAAAAEGATRRLAPVTRSAAQRRAMRHR